MEEMRDKENPTEPDNSKNKFTNQFENRFDFLRVVTPEPTFESVREGTTAAIILITAHVNNPFAFS